MKSTKAAIAIVVAGLAFACARRAAQSSAKERATPASGVEAAARLDAATAPSNDRAKSNDAPGGRFSYAPAGIDLNWPSGWQQTQKEGYEWTIVPAEKRAAECWISLDVPTLPLHPPGLIPIGRVESGYLDDLKKQYGKLDTKELTPPTLPNAKERFVRAAWQKDGQSMQQTALLLVHDDHVYILRERSDVDHEQPTRETFDAVVSSIKWKK
jgi:hypothetical protein